MNKILTTLAAAIILTGCATDRAEEKRNADLAIAASKIEVFYEKPERPCTVLGMIDAPAGLMGSNQDAINNAKIEAAKLGADAVVIKDVRSEADGFSFAATPSPMKHAVGLAVKWK